MISIQGMLGETKFRAAKVAARRGDYQALLGAGINVGAVGKLGPVPLAPDLVKVLASTFKSAPISDSDSLARAYQRAVLTTSADEVYRTLREVFMHVSHEPWFRQLADLPWRRVWTLNIDDAFQNSYAGTSRSEHQSLRTVSWDEPFSESGDLEIIHLHGHVHDREPRRLVFSFSEYQGAARERPVWDQVLGGVLGTRPLVAIGARLLDDPDIENLFLGSHPTAQAPSIVVDPYISDGNAFELERSGYNIARVSAEDFVEAWSEEFGLDAEGLAVLHSNSAVELPQFTRLQTNHTPPNPPSHDFFAGDEPTWNDICSRRTAVFGWVASAVEDLETWLDTEPRIPVVSLAYVNRLSGGSSGLLTIAREARRLHMEVIQFDKSSRFNVERVLDFCNDRGPVLLTIDGASEFGDDVDRLVRRSIERTKIDLFVLVVERPHNSLRLEGRLIGSYAKRARIIKPALEKKDASRIAQKLEEFGRLGALELKDPHSRVAHFQGRDVFSGLADVEYALGFRKRLETEVSALEAEWQKDVVLLLAFASIGGTEVGVIEASLGVGVPADRLVNSVHSDEHLSALVEIVDDRLRSRQRNRAIDVLIRDRGIEASLSALLSIVKGVAPLATRRGLRQRNRPAALVGKLMGAKQLRDTFPGQDIDAYYEELRITFGDWNARYWEQRAINAKLSRDWARAESFAARAVQLYDDAFTRTTYGTILINKARSLAQIRDDAWAEYYDRGRREFDAAVGHEPGNRVTAFAYLEAAFELLESVASAVRTGHADGGSDSVRELLLSWRGSYTALRVSLSPDEGFSAIDRAEKLSDRFEAIVGDLAIAL